MANHSAQPVVHYLKDYSPPSHLIDKIDLTFDIQDEVTRIVSRLVVQQNPDARPTGVLHLHGSVKLISIQLDGETLDKDKFSLSDCTDRRHH